MARLVKNARPRSVWKQSQHAQGTATMKRTSLAQSRQRPLRERTRAGRYERRAMRARAATVTMASNEVRMTPSSAQRERSKSLRRDVHSHPSRSRHCASAIFDRLTWAIARAFCTTRTITSVAITVSTSLVSVSGTESCARLGLTRYTTANRDSSCDQQRKCRNALAQHQISLHVFNLVTICNIQPFSLFLGPSLAAN